MIKRPFIYSKTSKLYKLSNSFQFLVEMNDKTQRISFHDISQRYNTLLNQIQDIAILTTEEHRM